MLRLSSLTEVVSMNIKYLRYLLLSHYIKVFLPLCLIVTLFFMEDFISKQVKSYFSKKTKADTQLFNIRLLGENADFARALADNRGNHFEGVNYDTYENREFINKQKNDIKIVKKSQSISTFVSEMKSRDKTEAKPSQAPIYEIGSIFIGDAKRFAVINKTVVKIGEVLPSGEEVADIEEGRVLLKGRWGNRWIYVSY